MDMLVAAGYEVVDNPYKRKLTREELLDLLDDKVVGLVAGLETIDREVLEKSKLQVVSRVGAGISNVDIDAACAMGIKVFNTPDAPTNAVAELTIGALLSLLRMIPRMDQALHEGKWQKKIGLQLQGKTVAIIGFGRIGRKVAALLLPFGVKILVVDPYVNESDCFRMPEGNTSGGTAGSRYCHNPQQWSRLPYRGRGIYAHEKGVYLLNVARGGVVSEKALIEALENKTVAGAWLDTFEEEPYNGILRHYPNVNFDAACRIIYGRMPSADGNGSGR
jgi:D-3-phosphoglycerate dehydrogenase